MNAFRLLTAVLALACATTTYAQARENGFSVILLVGENQAAPGGENLPPAPGVRKALADVKDFLPYRSYRVLDTQWMRRGSTRMKGPDDQEYEVEVGDVDAIIPNALNPPKAGTLRVAFKLQEAGASTNSSEEFGRSMAAADMEKRLAELQRSMKAGTVAEGAKARMRDDISQLERSIRMARARKLIDSQFEMAIGETVVVGTSKIGGDRGLVVLLTSVTTGGK